jgi:hypothetical protein
MTVKELIDKLNMQNQDAEVVIAFPLGDYGRNTGAEHICRIEERPVRESGYLSEFIVDEDEDEDENEDVTDKVVIS